MENCSFVVRFFMAISLGFDINFQGDVANWKTVVSKSLNV